MNYRSPTIFFPKVFYSCMNLVFLWQNYHYIICISCRWSFCAGTHWTHWKNSWFSDVVFHDIYCLSCINLQYQETRSGFFFSKAVKVNNLARLNSFSMDKMATFSQTIFSDVFSWMKIFVFVQYFTEVCSNSLTYIWGTRGRWVKLLERDKICWLGWLVFLLMDSELTG